MTTVPSSGRQRRKLAWSLGFRKCPACRQKALDIVKGKIVCRYCGVTL